MIEEIFRLPLIRVAVLASLPFSENRGAIIYGVASGMNPVVIYSISCMFNILAVIIVYWIVVNSFAGRVLHNMFQKYIERKIVKNREKLEKYEELALLVFVAVPFVGTGGYTGLLIASFLGMDFKKSSVVISAGILIAGAITLLASLGFKFVTVG